LKRFASLFRRGLVYWLPLALLLAMVAAHLVLPKWVDRFSLLAFDFYQTQLPRPMPDDAPVVIVDIDEQSLNRFGQWPWPRTIVAQLLERLREADAAVVAFDVLFTEPDRTSPQLLLALLTSRGASEEDAKRLLATMPDPDTQFAEAMAKAPVVIGFSLVGEGGKDATEIKAGYAVVGARGEDPWLFVKRSEEAVSALPAFLKAAQGNGFVNEPSDWDNVVRKVPLVLRLGDKPVPSLAAEALRVAQRARGYIAKYAGAQSDKSLGENSGLNAIKIGKVEVPIDRAGGLSIRYGEHDKRRYISAADVLSGSVDPARIAGSIVLVGSSAAGLNDLKATPIAPDMPGVEIHAQLLEQILQQDFLFRPDWGPGAEILFALLAGIVLIVAVPRLGALPGAAIGGISVAIALAISWFAFKNGALTYGTVSKGASHVLLDPVYPVFVLVALYLFSTLLNYRLTERRQREIRDAFSRYLSPQYVEQLARNPEKLVLGGEVRQMTIMFCDIRGFTSLSEGMTSHELGQLINEFLTPMTEIIMEHMGTIDKYIGDAIMAFWNAPLDDPDHARNAVAAAQSMRRKLIELNDAWQAEGRRTLQIGIGVNTGECSVGNFGSNQKFNYSLLGDPVNLASRLEGLTKVYGVDLILGEDTAHSLDQPDLIELDLVAVKGKSRAVRIYTLPPHPVETQLYLARHAALLDAYRRRDWQAALGLLEDPVLAGERDMAPVYGLFRERIAEMQVEPPPPDWDGVFVAHEK
jgi:adenylate cyclase